MLMSRMQAKIISIVVVVLMAGFGVMLYMVLKHQARDILKASHDKTELLASSVVSSLGWSMKTGNQEPVHELVNDLRGLEGIKEIRVFGRDAHELYVSPEYPEAGPELSGGVNKAIKDGAMSWDEGEMALTYYRPLLNDIQCRMCHEPGLKVLGAVTVSVPLDEAYAEIRHNRLMSVLNAVLVILAVCVVLWFWIKRYILRPVVRSVDVMGVMEKDKDLTLRMSSRSTDEMGQLSRSFNSFMDGIQNVVKRINRMSYQVGSVSTQVAVNSDRVLEGAQVQARAVESTSGAIEEMNASIKEVAESAGSLSQSAEAASASIMQMLASIDQITGSAAVLSESVDSTVSSLTEVSASVREVSSSVGVLSEAAERSVGFINDIASSIKNVENASMESARLSEKVTKDASGLGMGAMGRAIEGMVNIREAVENSGEVINRLGARSRQIGEILDVIDEVADQTELLSLNAAILASQAGEHGKGFAVVADEIKDLAERTASSTQEISKLIATVQAEATEAVDSMERGKKAVEDGHAVVVDARDMLEGIIESSARSSEMSKIIEKATMEQAEDVRAVTDAMVNIRDMVKNILRATQELTTGSDQIMLEAEKVRDVAMQVRMATEEQSKGSDQIIRAVENVSEQVRQIARATGEQHKGSEEFVHSIGRIADVANRNESLAGEMNVAVEELTRHVEGLKEEVGSFRSSGRDEDMIKLGVVPLESPAQMYKKFSPLARALSAATGREVVFKLTPTFSDTVKDIGTGVVDICYMTPTTYIEAHDRYGVNLLAKAVREGLPFSHTIIVVKAESSIRTLAEIKGRTFAFGDEMSTSSYLVPKYMLESEGVRLMDLKDYRFLGHHDDVAQAVLYGEFDAGGLRETTANQFKDKGLRFLKVSDDIPEFNFCARPGIEPGLADKIRAALTSLDAKDREAAKVLRAIDEGYTGFMDARDSDYDTIREMLART